MHADPVGTVVGALGVILLAGKLGGELATRLKQPAVLGELVAGIVLGNLSFGGPAPFQSIAANETIQAIAGIGALILLFEVGVESTVGQMLQVGVTSLFVALLGVLVPFALGWAVGAWLLPDASPYLHAFLGATLCATSVGITARVLQDLNASRTPEARIILGAAVIDDVLGLVILGAVASAIAAAAQGVPISVTSVAKTSGAAVVFLVGAAVHWHDGSASLVLDRVTPSCARRAGQREPEPVLPAGVGVEPDWPGPDHRRICRGPRTRRRTLQGLRGPR